MSLIYVVIAAGPKVLCDYTNYKGNFEQATAALLKKVQENTRASIQYGKEYAFFYWNIDGLTYLCMCDISFPGNVAFAFLESIKKEFNEAYPNEDFRSKSNYALNDAFKEKLSIKLDYYNKNKNKSLDKTGQLKEGVISFKNEVLETGQLLDQRGEKINIIAKKADQLSQDSSTFYKTAKNVKRNAMWKRVRLIILCTVGALILIYIIMVCCCGGFALKSCFGKNESS